LKQIKTERPKLAVLMLSMYAEEVYAVRALKAGASGYLTKNSPPARSSRRYAKSPVAASM
jgi:DNA-binding NarL/FixJ family response regulator